MMRKERIRGFTAAIWQWYSVHKRALPWRDLLISDDTERAYRILVSEVMLQQTQVDRVREIYVRFLREFPTLRVLAAAGNRQVILAWRGMGYNSRVLRLRDATRRIMDEWNGVFPQEMRALQSIKGLGHYTAAAIRNFAFNLPTPCIDTNIRRILHRTFVGPECPDGTWKKDDRYLIEIAEEVLHAALDGQVGHDARNWHAALMDFGSLVQTKKDPKWEECPLTRKGLMKATEKNVPQIEIRTSKPEPGRVIKGSFVPDRIVRGRVIEALRDAPAGLSLDTLGRRVAADWSLVAHRTWLTAILTKLRKEELVEERSGKYALRVEA
ncbi:MAG: hypothetical protein PHX87_01685 [Candidatus Peribacteraceae bacterium]|nr:hypothetical protein [Candidatus Peribacteraceae bacterium]MDD5742119.1 hypothetical protein [Candidatus Peribacteraceae bacterium]